ncbi:MAG: orotidine 5'-phosphate decarboxylase / HUMPS family protein, partial [Pseudomonadota bacterium]
MTAPADRILFAYDSTDIAAGREALAALGDGVGAVKLGKAFFTANGPQGVAALGAKRVFLDLKFHDIPNTVAGAIRAA